MKDTSTLLSIAMVTYNHEKTIARALDSILAQKRDFGIKILVGDDCSTDLTAEIVQDYYRRYPDIIQPFLHEKNMGATNNSLFLYEKANTEFLALCDGDDYWPYNNKIQKQIDCFRANPQYSIVFHPTQVLFEDNKSRSYFFPYFRMIGVKKEFTIQDLLKRNIISSSSCMYRWRFRNGDVKQHYPSDIAPGDWFLHLLHAQVGNIGYLTDTSSVYWRSDSGVWSKLENKDTMYTQHGIAMLNFYEKTHELFDMPMSAQCLDLLRFFTVKYLGEGLFFELERFAQKYKPLFDVFIQREMEKRNNHLLFKSKRMIASLYLALFEERLRGSFLSRKLRFKQSEK